MKKEFFTSCEPTLADERAPYVAPSIEVIDVVTEGVIAGSGVNSGNLPDIGNGGGAWTSSNARSSYSASPASDIEDMITDILTIEQ